MKIDWLRTLYAYSRWANDRVLETAAALSPDELTRPGGVGYGSVRDILVHTMTAQWIWLSRWQGVSPTGFWNPADFPDLAAIRTRWHELEEETAAFLAGLDADRIMGEVVYASTRGAPRRQPLWQLLLHQANHATQHRSEAAYLLTQLGRSPGDLDLLAYLLQGGR
jgi:uncharacterized damage-inducible protein DinB